MDIDDVIHHEISEGQASESGRFTMTLEAMVARLQLQGSGQPWWMARLVQAAVASGCRSLEMKSSGRLDFDTRSDWSAEALHEALTHPERPVEKWLEHLRRGLWVCGWQERLAWKFRLPGRELAFQDGQLTLLSHPGQATCLQIQTRLEPANLAQAAYPCPIDCFWESTAIPRIETIRPDLIAMSQAGAEPTLTVARSGEHVLYWVEDGVILEAQSIWPERAQTKLKVWGYADATGIPRDASGYALIRGPELKERSLQMQKALARQLQDLQPRSLPPPRTSRLQPLFSGAKAAGATWTTGWMLGDPGLGTLFACFAGALGMVYGSVKMDFDSQSTTVDDDTRVELRKLKDSLARWYYDH